MEKTKKTYECTIVPELFEAWKILKRRKDADAIADEFGFSRPVIDRALLYGYVKMPEVKERINQFFKRRQDAERATAQELNPQ